VFFGFSIILSTGEEKMTTLVVKYNAGAVAFTRALFGNRIALINQWMEERTVFCVILWAAAKPVAFAFLHKFATVVLLDYVYTLEPQRRKKHATRLLEALASDARFRQLRDMTEEEVAGLQKKEYPLLVDGALRHHDNLVLAKSRYGSTFRGVLVMTDYFGVARDYMTLVCHSDRSLVLGAPMYADKCALREYNVAIVDGILTGHYRVEMTAI
jgi:hypothetical protein